MSSYIDNIKIKICCIKSIEEANMAIEARADCLGLVSRMPSGPGVISEDLIEKIIETIPDHISTFLLSAESQADKIIAQHHKMPTNFIQLVDEISPNDCLKIKEAIPDVKLVKVIHVSNKKSIDEAINITHAVDMILLDSGQPQLKVKILGGTGNVHNWDISKEIVNSVDIPVYLAGGIRSDNVLEAIQKVNPYGIDLCSGVRTQDQLDKKKLKIFFNTLKGNSN